MCDCLSSSVRLLSFPLGFASFSSWPGVSPLLFFSGRFGFSPAPPACGGSIVLAIVRVLRTAPHCVAVFFSFFFSPSLPCPLRRRPFLLGADFLFLPSDGGRRWLTRNERDVAQQHNRWQRRRRPHTGKKKCGSSCWCRECVRVASTPTFFPVCFFLFLFSSSLLGRCVDDGGGGGALLSVALADFRARARMRPMAIPIRHSITAVLKRSFAFFFYKKKEEEEQTSKSTQKDARA